MQKDAHVCVSGLGFPMERDSATLRDKETEVSSLSQDKGHQDKLKILPWDGTGRDGTKDWTITSFLEKSGTEGGMGWDNNYFFPIISCFRTFLLVSFEKVILSRDLGRQRSLSRDNISFSFLAYFKFS